MTKLRFAFQVDGLSEDLLVVRGFKGQESLSDSTFQHRQCLGFCYEIALASRKENLTPEQVVDKFAKLHVYQNGELTQRVHGIVRSFTQGDIGHNHTFYSVTLVPALERLSLRHNSRIFQHKSASDIISILLKEMGITDYAFLLKRQVEQREFCVQYRETDLEFLHRLASEEGWTYSFEHEVGKHTLVFSDSSDSLPKLNESVPYNGNAGGVAPSCYISSFYNRTQSDVSEVTLKDYSFKKPQYSFLKQQFGSNMSYQREGYEHFDAPGRYKDDVNGKVFSKVRLEYFRRESHLAFGKSNHARLRSGMRFDLSEHLNAELNRSWLIVKVNHKGEQPQALEEDATQGATTYHNSFEVIPATQNWQAIPQPKPQVDGPMMAIVVGPEGEEIYCDEFGRVKVHFPWDRYSNGDEHSSCWVRVSQGWAGSQYGMMALPRIGHEVIVEFLNGDPDQPIITGRTYHAVNTPPYSLPEHKTKMVIRSETHQGEGFNELSFEDQVDNEEIYLHAQKDLEALINNDHTTHIKHDKHLTVDNDSFIQIQNNHHLTVEGESRSKIGKDKSLIVCGDAHEKVGSLYAFEAGNEVHIKAGQKVVIEAGAELTIKAGGSFVKVDPSGVSLVGSGINLNSGGSAGSGSGFGGQVALMPNGVEAIEAPNEMLFVMPTPTLLQQVTADLEAGMPITQVCQKQSDGSCPLKECPCGNNQ